MGDSEKKPVGIIGRRMAALVGAMVVALGLVACTGTQPPEPVGGECYAGDRRIL